MGPQLTPDGKDVAFNSTEGKQAADFYVGLTKYAPPQYLNSNSYDGRIAFEQGQVGMYMAGNWLAATMQDDAPEFTGHWATAPLPKGPAGCATTLSGDALVLFKTDQQRRGLEVDRVPFQARDHRPVDLQGDSRCQGCGQRHRAADAERSAVGPALYKAKPVLTGFAKDMKDCGIPSRAAQLKVRRGRGRAQHSAGQGDVRRPDPRRSARQHCAEGTGDLRPLTDSETFACDVLTVEQSRPGHSSPGR